MSLTAHDPSLGGLVLALVFDENFNPAGVSGVLYMHSRPHFGKHDLNCSVLYITGCLSRGYVRHHSTSINPITSRMVNLDTNSPQLRLVKRLIDGYCSLDMSNVEPLLSEDYQYEILPECAELPKQTKESHLQMWGKVFCPGRKAEVRIRHRGTAFRSRLISTTSR